VVKNIDQDVQNHAGRIVARAALSSCICDKRLWGSHTEKCMEHQHELLALDRQRLGLDLIDEEELDAYCGTD
jgi:hypothetical protein